MTQLSLNYPDSEQHTPEKSWRYKEIEKRIFNDLSNALILYSMRLPNLETYNVAPLTINDNWEINWEKGKEAKDSARGPADVSGTIEKVKIHTIWQQLNTMIINSDTVDPQDKIKYQRAIDRFIQTHFLSTHKSKLKKVNFYNFYTHFSAEKAKEKGLSPETQQLYQNICICFAKILSQKDPKFLDSTGEINKYGLQYIGKAFLKTIKNIPSSGTAKAFHKIFHDGDFNFIRKENLGEPQTIGTLDHYVNAIIYLIDANGFNAYAEGGESGKQEWNKSKKAFLNLLFNVSQGSEEERCITPSSKERFHQDFVKIWDEVHEELNQHIEATQAWEPSSRYKTDSSKIMKIGGKSNNITDESGIRSTYYGNLDDKEAIKSHIKATLKQYLPRLLTNNGVSIKSIEVALKGNFISPQDVEEIKELLSEDYAVTDRAIKSIQKSGENGLDTLIDKYESLNNGKKMIPKLQAAYKIASGNIARGANGDYQDFKLIVHFEIDPKEYEESKNQELSSPFVNKDAETIPLYQEISFYPVSNDLNMGNHHFLDLEKKIFLRIKNVSDKNISLNRLRLFTETTISDISVDIDRYEEKVKKGIIPQPPNDDYKYLKLDGQQISLKDMVNRTPENSDRFDQAISLILNYFIKRNKIFYINTPTIQHSGLITPDLLKDNATYKLKKFTSSQELKHIAKDINHENDTICFYSEEEKKNGADFYYVRVGDIGDILTLEKLCNIK